MERITCGGASTDLVVGNDGIVLASFRGVLSMRNAGALSARVLQAGAERGGIGVLADLQGSLAALPPLGAAHYGYIPPGLRDVPGAFSFARRGRGVAARAGAVAGREPRLVVIASMTATAAA